LFFFSFWCQYCFAISFLQETNKEDKNESINCLFF